MGIYIKNMKAPATCCHCPLMDYDPDIEWDDGGRKTQGAYICVITHELIDNTKREDHCPLVPVPPHGRLIDADALKDVQQADADFFKGSSDYGEKCRYDEAINAVANIVNAPTIIPAEEGEA